MSRKVTPACNLGRLYPGLAGEWHPDWNGDLTPYEVAPGSGRKVCWRCERGHEWRAQIVHRKYYGTGCIYCVKRKRTFKPVGIVGCRFYLWRLCLRS